MSVALISGKSVRWLAVMGIAAAGMLGCARKTIQPPEPQRKDAGTVQVRDTEPSQNWRELALEKMAEKIFKKEYDCLERLAKNQWVGLFDLLQPLPDGEGKAKQ